METLELLGFYYITLADHTGYNFLLIIIGGIAGVFLKKTDLRMARGTYYLNTALLMFAASISQTLWLQTIDGMINGYLFVVALVDITVWISIGFGFAFIAKSRSNDAYGTSKSAYLAFIPLANLALVFAPSKDQLGFKSSGATSGVSAVVLGFIVMGAANMVQKEISNSLEKTIESYANSDFSPLIREKYFDFTSRSEGLDAGLKYLASLEEVGQKLDEITSFDAIDVSNKTMTYHYKILDGTITGASNEFQKNIQKENCITFEQAIQRGARIDFIYTSDVHGILASISSNSENCE